MNDFAGNIRKWDTKLQLVSNQEEITMDDVIQSLKFSTGKASDVLWENLIPKVWNKLNSIDRQIFVSEIKGKEDKPRTLRDFYVSLMDYFLDTVKSDDNGISETADMNTEIKYAVNF
jgi:hypothetical protein